ncbi:AAA family ATPase [Nostoc sp. HG1]|nr:AAA family ATPase [Nostoc sp. HG1]
MVKWVVSQLNFVDKSRFWLSSPARVGKSRALGKWVILKNNFCITPKDERRNCVRHCRGIFSCETGKSPTDLQKDIFRKALEGKTYEQIAENCNCNLSYVKELGSELWRLLSSALGKTVRKKSFKNVLEEYDRSSPILPLPEKLPESAIARSQQDWGEAPDVSVFYGRTEELTALNQWIVTDGCRLVALLGMGGIGKTSLSVKVAQNIQNDFDFIIWRSLDRTPLIHTFLKDIIRFICGEQEKNLPETPSDAISRAIECLNAHRCLVIIDGVETIMETGQLAGRYRDGYQDYGRFFKKVGELNHKKLLGVDKFRKIYRNFIVGTSKPPCSLS